MEEIQLEFDHWVRNIPWRRKWLPIPVFFPEELQGHRSLVGYSSWGHKESDTIVRAHMWTHTQVIDDLAWRSWSHRTGNTYNVFFKKSIESLLLENQCIYALTPEKAMAPNFSTFAWKIPWTEEPGRLQSMGSLRVRHD